MSEIINSLVPIDAISPHPRNYRSHPESQLENLKASHKRFSQYRSVVLWQQPDHQFIQVAGHGILEAMRERGVTLVRADILPEDTPEEDIDGILAADNLLPLGAVDDETLLARLLQEQQEAGYDLRSLGSDEEALRQMLANLGDENVTQELPDSDESVPLPEEEQTRVKPGDIWQLGKHRIGCLNSLDEGEVRRLLSGRVPTFIFSDPPYGLEIVATNGYVGGGEAYDIPFGGVKKHKGDVGGSASHMRKTGKPYIAEQGLRGSDGASKPFGSKDDRGSIGGTNPPGSKNNMRIAPTIEAGKYFPVIGDESTATAIAGFSLCVKLCPKALQIWWGANYYANALPPSPCWIVWDKQNTGNFADVELAWCSEKKAARLFSHMWNGMLKESEHGQRRVHPTQKPVALATFCFEEFGRENDVIYDPFLGSGISVIAGEFLERTVYGCELSPAYIDVIIKRWEKETNQQAQLVERLEVVS